MPSEPGPYTAGLRHLAETIETQMRLIVDPAERVAALSAVMTELRRFELILAGLRDAAAGEANAAGHSYAKLARAMGLTRGGAQAAVRRALQ